jgi:hypothetical protein
MLAGDDCANVAIRTRPAPASANYAKNKCFPAKKIPVISLKRGKNANW